MAFYGSPFAMTKTMIPIRLNTEWLFLNARNPLFVDMSDSKYTLDMTGGGFLEGDFEYGVTLSQGFIVGAWAKGSWFRVKGTGNLTADDASSFLWQGRSADIDAEGSVVTRSIFAAGVSGNLSF